jgi:D-alanyl-D-alanine carboxypeptidase (penicillin-binding protein 5/6)
VCNGSVITSQAARGPSRHTRSTVSARRRRALIGAVLALLLAHAAFASSSSSGPAVDPHRVPATGQAFNERQAPLATARWPKQGQAALMFDGGRPGASPHQRAAPIASVAKVMTAYLTLERYPLSAAQDGFTITVTEDEARFEARGQSVVAVRAGEQLTERQLLEALLIPSGNNIAWMLAAKVAGSETRFVAEMNAQARALGMHHTTYTDPSGFDPATVSTAADQLRVFERAMRFGVFRQIVSMASVTLPVAGTLRNYNPLIAEGYGGKTGSDSAAGGCLAFFTDVAVDGRPRTAMGVVLGQGQGSNTTALLAATGVAARRLVESVAAGTGAQPAASGRPRFLTPGRRAAADVMTTDSLPTGEL